MFETHEVELFTAKEGAGLPTGKKLRFMIKLENKEKVATL